MPCRLKRGGLVTFGPQNFNSSNPYFGGFRVSNPRRHGTMYVRKWESGSVWVQRRVYDLLNRSASEITGHFGPPVTCVKRWWGHWLAHDKWIGIGKSDCAQCLSTIWRCQSPICGSKWALVLVPIFSRFGVKHLFWRIWGLEPETPRYYVCAEMKVWLRASPTPCLWPSESIQKLRSELDNIPPRNRFSRMTCYATGIEWVRIVHWSSKLAQNVYQRVFYK